MRPIIATALRIGIPLIALVLYAWHITPTLIRQFGHVPLGDSEHILLSHQNRTYRYTLSDSNGSTDLGTLSQRLGWQDTFFNIETTLRIQRIEDLPSFSLLGTNGLSGPLSLDASTDLDDRQRLIAFSAQGSVSVFSGNIEGHVSGKDILGDYQIVGGKKTAFSFDGIDTSTRGGLSFVMALSPDLQVGDSFRTNSLGISAAAPYVKQSHMDYEVLEELFFQGPYGTIECLKVSVSNNLGEVMTLMVDDRGVIHQALLSQFPLRAQLERIIDEDGDQLWPAPEALDSSL